MSTINRVTVFLIAVAAMAVTATCRHAGDEAGAAPKYPRRRPGCSLSVFHTPTPTGIAAWDDLGVAEVGCHINIPEPQCLRRLMEEACRMGGDIIYDVPARPLRPRDEVLLFRGQVAHTRTKEGKPQPEEAPPPIEQDAGPIEPLIPSVRIAPPAPVDAGAAG